MEDRRKDWLKIALTVIALISQLAVVILAYADLKTTDAILMQKIEDVSKRQNTHENHPAYHNNMIQDNDLKYMTHKDGDVIDEKVKSIKELIEVKFETFEKQLLRIESKLGK